MEPENCRLLLDQNLPYSITSLFRENFSLTDVSHTYDLGLALAKDEDIIQFAQTERRVVVTFDEDFADQRQFPLNSHCGVVRLRIEPTTMVATIEALKRLFETIEPPDLYGKLVIVTNQQIRVLSKA